MFVTHSLARNREELGTLVFVEGEYLGKFLRLQEKEEIIIGRDPLKCSLIFEEKDISREHCRVRYDRETEEYVFWDCSRNGCFVNGIRLEREKEYRLSADTRISIGFGRNVFMLG